MSCHASSWPRATSPRRATLARRRTGSSRSRRVISASTWRRAGPASAMAWANGASWPGASVTNTARCQASRGVGRVEAHEQADPVVGDRAAPLLHAVDDLGPQRDGRVERAAVEPGQHGLAHVVGRANVRRRRRQHQAPGALAVDGLDHARQHRTGQRPPIDPRLARQHAAGRLGGHLAQAAGLDERGRPPHGVGCAGVAGAAGALALAQLRDDRAAGAQLDRPAGDLPQPPHARAHALDLARPGGHQPAEHVAHGDGDGRGVGTARHRHRAVLAPPRRRRARRRQPVRQLRRRDGRRPRTGGPRHDPARLPRHLHLHGTDGERLLHRLRPARLGPFAGRPRLPGPLGPGRRPSAVVAALPVLAARRGRPGRRGGRGRPRCPPRLAGDPAPRLPHPLALRLEVGDHQLALLPAEAPGLREAVVGVADHREQRRPPRRAMGVQDGQLLGCRPTVDLGADVRLEL